jgi:putative ATP-binding cassette transporter
LIQLAPGQFDFGGVDNHHCITGVHMGGATRKLSEGQKKRLALAVAYLEDRHIYFFDEWAANQDPEFRKVFYTQLLPAMKDSGKTVIVITHDDKYMYIADRTIKMEYGTIDCEIGAQSGKGAA